jgi:hypothetical protein
MHEHGGKQRWEVGYRIGKESPRDKCPLDDECVTQNQFSNEEDRIHQNQEQGDERKRATGTVVVANGE